MPYVSFWRGNTQQIADLPIKDGQLVYNTETGDIYQDVGLERLDINKNLKKSIADNTNSLSALKKIEANKTFTVGAGGDYVNLNTALTALSNTSAVYKNKGIKVELKILTGTVIAEQIAVLQNDLGWITITSEDKEVSVNSIGWDLNGLNEHDLREDVAFIGGENNAVLPTIGTLFKLNTKGTRNAVGYFANKNSSGLILPECGFTSFYDGVIANNESNICIREGIANNCSRWGIHARHNGEITARSALLDHCSIGAYADRIADIDARYADVSSCAQALYSNNASRINANASKAWRCTGSPDGLVRASSGSLVNADKMDIQLLDTGTVFYVSNGSSIVTNGATIPAQNAGVVRFNQVLNVPTVEGTIFGDSAGNVVNDAKTTKFNTWSSSKVDEVKANKSLDINGATVDQFVQVSSVDESGSPTGFKTITVLSAEGMTV